MRRLRFEYLDVGTEMTLVNSTRKLKKIGEKGEKKEQEEETERVTEIRPAFPPSRPG